MKPLLYWLAGYLRLIIRGGAPERLLNLAAVEGIPLWQVREQGGYLSACLLAAHLRYLRPLARRARCRVRVQAKLGFPFLWRRARRRPGLLVGLVLGAVLVVASTSFVFFVEVRGSSPVHHHELLELAQRHGLRPGVFKPTFDRETWENTLARSLPYVSWVRLSFSGILARIDVAEREALPPPPVEEVPADVVAEKEGELVYFLALMGVPQAQVGDRVRAGQVLISGVIPGRPLGEGKFSLPRLVAAKGICLARVRYQARAEVPLQRVVSHPTGRVWRSWVVRVAGGEIVWRGKVPFATYHREETRAVLGGRNGKPVVEVLRMNYRELQPVTCVLTPEEAAWEARDKALEEVRRRVPPDAERELIEAVTEFSSEGAAVTVTVVAVEDIGRVAPGQRGRTGG